MAYTRFAFPDFNQQDSSPLTYTIGTVDAVAGRWVRVSITFNARPLADGTLTPGTFYSVTVLAPDGSSTLLGAGLLAGGFAWYPGGAIGAFLPAMSGTYTLQYSTTGTSGTKQILSGCCQYVNVTAVVETPSILKPGMAPVTVMAMPTIRVDSTRNTFRVGSFPAVIGQDYKLTCAFDAAATTSTLEYNLAGRGFSALPEPFRYDDRSWSKCYVTAVVTAQAETCEVDLYASVVAGPASIYHGCVIAEPFVSPIVP